MNKLPTLNLIEEPVNVNTDLLWSAYHNAKHIGYHAVKLNILKSKQARYESHKSFLARCLEVKIIPKGLVLDLEATTGNQVQEFLDSWFDKFKNLFPFQ